MLSEKTLEAIDNLFSPKERVSIQELLESECSKLALGCESWTDTQMERIWFAVLKLGSNNSQLFLEAVELARIDWRDLLISAGFGDDIQAHEKWWHTIAR